MEIKRYFLTKSDNTRRMEKMEKIEYIIITSSKYKGFSALKNRNVIEKLKYKQDREFSCHYIIEKKGNIVNIIPEKECAICTHNVDIDSKSISIMLTIDNEGKYTCDEMDSLKKLLKKIIRKYNIKSDNILYEYDINCSRRPLDLADEPILLYELVHSL